jgi:teichuronic acid biosynthesis glycosyltransferase TuaH
LKLLEYPGAGLPVVSTDLPATRRLDTPLIHTATDRARFVAAVERVLGGADPGTPALTARVRPPPRLGVPRP